MKLSVVIVNYNVAPYLEQCLHSVFKAAEKIEREVFVVDNASVDSSVEMVRTLFPQVRLIESKENLGFSKGNNLALKKCQGQHILLLNPDTVVEENCFEECLAHMEDHPECGGLGIQMMDGTGNFLPESKRGLPTPIAAFYKISGLYRLFPRSGRINRYYAGALDHKETGEVEILAGAFMWMRKSVLDEVGLLDESFFMYGEDIDLSYRITQAGYTNRYLPSTRIIHYKGESTKKGSMNYVYVFYQAMAIFARKHFRSGGSRSFILLIQLAIGLRASLSFFRRILQKGHLFMIDAIGLYGGMHLLKTYWEQNHRFISGGSYPDEFMQWVAPAYIAVWLLSAGLSGAYDRPVRLSLLQKGIAAGSLILIASYGLLDENWRFSRALLLLGSAWALLFTSLVRWILHAGIGGYIRTGGDSSRIWLIGDAEGIKRSEDALKRIRPNAQLAGSSSWPSGPLEAARMSELIATLRLDEIIFDAESMATGDIIDRMLQLQGSGVELRILPPKANFIVGSQRVFQAGDGSGLEGHVLSTPLNQRNKRATDHLIGWLAILLAPVLCFSHLGRHILKNIAKVWIGEKTWVGFKSEPTPSGGSKREAVIHCTDLLSEQPPEAELTRQIDLLYARDYRWRNDLNILWRSLFHSKV